VSDPKPKIIKREVRFTLTQGEFVERSKSLAQADRDLSTLDRGYKDTLARFRAQRELKKQERTLLSNIIQDGWEFRTAECAEVMDYQAHMVLYYFGADVIDQRPMTDEEKQIEMNLANS